MTETTPIPPEPTQVSPTQATQADDLSLRPGDVLLHLIITLLAPMFLGASGGDIHLARMAAFETVTAYRAGHQADLIAIAQIIACGLAALGSLSLSMADDLSLSMTLRLRGNANALGRTAEHNRRAVSPIRSGHVTSPQPQPAPDTETRSEPADADFEAAVVAGVARTQRLAAEARTVRDAGAPIGEPAPATSPAPSAAPAAMTQHQRQALWGAAMADVAAEYVASLPLLPPAQRKAASVRAAALNSTANDLIAGTASPTLAPAAAATLIRPRAA